MSQWFEQSPTLAASFISLVVLLALLGLGWSLRNRFKIALSLFYDLFCLLVAAYVWLLISHKYGLLKDWQLGLYLKWYIAVVIFFAVWFATKVFSTFFWDIYLFEHRKTQVPGLLRSIVTVLILSAAILLIVRFIFDRSLSGLLVASSVTVAVLIFALQDFLSGLIAGITISIEPPFGVGDWIMVGDIEGEVVDINWRATTLQTFDQTYLVIPNSIISKNQILNFYKPTKLHALHLFVGVEYGVPPSVVKEILIACALESRGVLSVPKPISRLVNYGDFAITYEIKFFIENHSISQDVKDDIMTRIWYNLRRRGIRIPFPIRDVFVHEEVKKEAVEEMNLKRIEGFLRRASIFEPLDGADIKALASSGRVWPFGKGEHIVKQGEAGSSLFLILDGSASVHINRQDNGGDIVVGRLSAGDFFGEKSLLTGEPRGASIVAETDLEVVEIEKANLIPLLESSPGILEELSRRLAERQLMNEGFFKQEHRAEEVASMRTTYSARFLKSMKAFFRL